ncbi:MAG: hypothetical protein K1X57_13265 [Gemmataceae bacterium]|nr:hypothetical protein [Gemmataceae bacterium]
MSSFLRTLISSRTRPQANNTRRRNPLRRFLRAQSLEDRTVPATFTVLNTNDGAVAAAGDLPGSLRQAIFDANALPGADSIVIDASLGGQTLLLGFGELLVTEGVTITGPALLPGNVPNFTIDALLGSRHFNLNSATAKDSFSISRLNLLQGSGADFGGSISLRSPDDNVTLTDMVLSSNTTGNFGGAFGAASINTSPNPQPAMGTINITRCSFTNNVNNLNFGGAVSLEAQSNSAAGPVVTSGWKLNITDSNFDNNASISNGNGGALFVRMIGGAVVNVSGTTFSNNQATGYGGAVSILTAVGGPVTFSNCTFSGNTATNAATGRGAAVAIGGGNSGPVNFYNCTITGNVNLTGGAIAQTSGSSNITLESTITYGNIVTTPGLAPDFSGGKIIAKNSIIENSTGGASFTNNGGNIIGVAGNPVLQPLANNGGLWPTHLPGPFSPAREAGINPLALAFDARGAGFPRTLGAKTDIGAIESLDPNPLAQASLANVTAPGATYQFTVTYSDDKAINTSTIIGKNDVIQVTGPNAFSQFATYISIDNAANGTPRNVVYQITAPVNGAPGFDKTDNGIYTVAIVGSKVFDNDTPTPLPINAGNLDTFSVGVPTNFVVTNDNASGAGSLLQAITDANSSIGSIDSITFDPAFFSIPRTIKLAGEITISDPLLVIGPANAGLVTISGEMLNRVFTLDGPGDMTVNMSGVTIANGNAADNGGAINNTDETLVLNNCVFSSNSATTNGGAIWLNVAAASLTMTNTKFTNNSSGNGGAIARISNGSITIDSSTFSGNFSGASGGAISMSLGSLTVENSTFVGNSAAGSGGAVSTVDGLGKVFYRNSTFSGNSAAVAGGAISTTHYGSSLEIFNSTIVNNDAPSGGGVSHTGSPGGSVIGGFNIVSSIISNNTTGTFEVNSTGFDTSYSHSILGSLGGGAKIIDNGGNLPLGTNALVGPLGNYGGPTQTVALFTGSPAVNAGANPGGLTFDQRGAGFPRVVGGTIDIGAFEGTLPIPGGGLVPLGPITKIGTTPNSVQVIYTDDTGINVSSIGTSDIDILDPLSNKLTITGFSIDNPTNGTPRTVTYTFTIPGGTWTNAQNGTYTVNLKAGQILDLDTPTPNTNVGYTMGTFLVNVPIIYTVDILSDVDDGNTTAGNLSIREAVRLSNDDAIASEIRFSPTVFASKQTITLLNGQLGVTQPVTITGPTAGVVLNGNGTNRCIDVTVAAPGAVMNFSNLTLTNGAQTATTGDADAGGALAINDESVTLTNCTLSNNTSAARGGAIDVSNGAGRLNLIDCVVSGNQVTGANAYKVGDGGAINLVGNSSVNITRSTLSGNSVTGQGGAVYFTNGGSINVVDSTISGNTAAGSVGGGGIYLFGTVTADGFNITNSTLSGNVATAGPGGAIGLQVMTGTLNIRNSTIFGNNASGSGGGIGSDGGGTVFISSSIVAGNLVGGVPTAKADLAFSVAETIAGNNNLIGIQDVTTNVTLSGTGNLTGTIVTPLDAKLGALANNGGPTQTHAILAGSPAIDAGNNSASLSFDQRGQIRVQSSSADIGAFESAFSLATPAKVTSVSVNGGGIQRSRVTSLVVTFDNAPTFAGSPAAAFTLERFVAGVGTGNTVTLGASVLGNVVTLTFSGALTEAVTNSLIDGVYQLRIDDAQLTNLDGDANGSIGGDYATPTTSAGGGIFRLFGDADGSGLVDTSDFLAFRLQFLSSNPTFDADGNGSVDTGDFLRFRLNFLKSV